MWRERSKAPATSTLAGARLGSVRGQTSRARAGHVHAHSRRHAYHHLSTRARARGLRALCSRRHPTASRHLGQVALDGTLFVAAQVELPGEEDEGDPQCEQVSMQRYGQRDLEEGRVDALALGTGTWGSSSPEVQRS